MADAPRVVFTAQSKRYFYCREAVCEFAFSRQAIPLNPFMAFGYFLADRTDREDVREANDAILCKCDELWVFGRELANGVLHEIALAADAKMPIRFFSIDDRCEGIVELHVDSLQFEEEVRKTTGYGRDRLLADLKAHLPASSPDQSLALEL